MSQSVKRSWAESWINILVGYWVNFTANLLILPLFGFHITVQDNFLIGAIFTAISLARSFIIRRIMARGD